MTFSHVMYLEFAWVIVCYIWVIEVSTTWMHMLFWHRGSTNLLDCQNFFMPHLILIKQWPYADNLILKTFTFQRRRSCLSPTCSDQRWAARGFFWSVLIRIRTPPSPAILAGKQLRNGPTQHCSALISTDQSAQRWMNWSALSPNRTEWHWTELSDASCYYDYNKKEVHGQGLNHGLHRLCNRTGQYYH